MADIIDMSTIRAAHRGHWFDPSSMRFFRSRVGSFGYLSADRSRAFFVSSEQFADHTGYRADRLYTVRVIDLSTGDIDDVGGFQRYASHRGATLAAERLAEGQPIDGRAKA